LGRTAAHFALFDFGRVGYAAAASNVAHLLNLTVVDCESFADLLFVEAGDWFSKESAAAALENGRRPLGPTVLLGKNKDGSVIARIVISEGEDWS
jgi:hypothetical protein